MKGGKEVHIQNINPNVIQKKKRENINPKMLKIHCCKHCCKLWNQPPHKKKKKRKKKREVIIKQLWNKNQETRNVI